MKKLIISVLSVFLMLLLVAPTFFSVVSFAANESSEVNIWDTLDPAYMGGTFANVAERVKGNDIISPMSLKLVSNGYALYCDANNGEVVCLKLAKPDADGNYKMTNGVYDYAGYYTTNPYSTGRSESQTKAPTANAIKQSLLSQVLIKYTENASEIELNSYKDAALNGQITVKDIRGGIRVEYTLGREEVKYLAPRRIRYDKWMNLLVQIAENATDIKSKKTFWAFYSLVAISPDQLVDNIDKSALSPAVRDYLYMTRKEAADKGVKLSYGADYGIVPSYFDSLETDSNKVINDRKKEYPFVEKFAFMRCETILSAAELKKIERVVKLNTTYTYEQMADDHSETEYSGADKIPALFKMAIEYTINEDGLQLRLNAGNIRFDNSNYKLSNISFLPYAGAADTNNNGYLFYPDGSGSIIDLAAIKGTQFTTTNTMFGSDQAYHDITGANKEVMRYPTFGVLETDVKKEKYTETQIVVNPETGEEETKLVEMEREIKTSHGYLAAIIEGDSLAKVTVSSGGSLHMFASVYTSFNPRPKDSYYLSGGLSAGSNAMWTVESKRKYTGDYKLQIFILDDKQSTHAGMANVYRAFLEKNKIITRLTPQNDNSADIPLYVQTLGAIEVQKTILGFPVMKMMPLTSFERVEEILKNLQKAGITNVKTILKGWTDGGLFQYVPNGLDILDVLGGEEGFKKMLETAKATGATIFPDFDFAVMQNDKMFDGFSMDDDLVKTIDDQYAGVKGYDPVWQAYIFMGSGVISPNVMDKFYNNTYAEYQKFNVGGIAVSTLGQMLSSDFNEDDPLNREDSKKLIVNLLKKISEQNKNVLVSGGNFYTLPYATDIVDLSLDDSRYTYSAASVPFYGMLLHGYKDFTGTPINLAGNYQYTLLKTIENGASPYFIVAVDNTAELKRFSGYSSLNDYYSVKYSIWFADMVGTYNKLNNALKSVKYSLIVNHEFLDSGYKVVRVTYDNGEIFYINYLRKDYTVTVDGKELIIPAQDFVKIEA